MVRNAKGLYKDILERTGFELDETSSVMHGVKNGYEMLIYASDASHPNQLKLTVAVKGAHLTPQELKETSSAACNIAKIEQQNNCIVVFPKNVLLAAKLGERIQGLVEETASFLQQHQFEPCCQVCGKDGSVMPANVGGRYVSVCDECFAALQQELETANHIAANKKENVIGGVVGAFLGSLLGAVCIILVSQLGYVAAISGLVMAICTLKGYTLLGGKLTAKGIVISVVIMLLMTYMADRLDWAIVVARELEEDLFVSYQAIPELISAEVIAASDYYANLGMVYLFLVVGAVPTVWAAVRGRGAAVAYRMESGSTCV